jgi:acetoacetyl-CoA reductase
MTKLALVTGGTRGIGAAIAKSLKDNGYNVVANYVGNDQNAQEFSQATGIKVYKCDVSDFQSSYDMIQKIEKDFNKNIEILINNAGISRDSMAHKMPPEKWNDVINTNLNSLYNVTRNVIEKMREKKFGRIVNISSINGLTGQLGLTNYCAAKSGVIGYTRALALENASKSITVNAIAPGYIKTELIADLAPEVLDKIKASIPVGNLGQPEDVARTVLFLVDDASWFITGETISVNGGQYMV